MTQLSFPKLPQHQSQKEILRKRRKILDLSSSYWVVNSLNNDRINKGYSLVLDLAVSGSQDMENDPCPPRGQLSFHLAVALLKRTQAQTPFGICNVFSVHVAPFKFNDGLSFFSLIPSVSPFSYRVGLLKGTKLNYSETLHGYKTPQHFYLKHFLL